MAAMSTYVFVVTSPATTTSPVVKSVSQATRLAGSPSSMAWSTASEIWSAILSGCPSVTDSEVNVVFTLSSHFSLVGDHSIEHRIGHCILGGQRDLGHTPVGVENAHRVGVVVEPGSGRAHVIHDQEVDTLAGQLVPAPRQHVVRLRRESDH